MLKQGKKAGELGWEVSGRETIETSGVTGNLGKVAKNLSKIPAGAFEGGDVP